ncbi:hypothetical protein D6D17_06417 [Aureobasidium pullulans]|nr:hypothetical protein D6D17_06417 [Aureobasidium pullulans]
MFYNILIWSCSRQSKEDTRINYTGFVNSATATIPRKKTSATYTMRPVKRHSMPPIFNPHSKRPASSHLTPKALSIDPDLNVLHLHQIEKENQYPMADRLDLSHWVATKAIALQQKKGTKRVQPERGHHLVEVDDIVAPQR